MGQVICQVAMFTYRVNFGELREREVRRRPLPRTRVNRGIMYRVAYRILVASLVLCLLLVGGLLLLERTGSIEIDEKAIQPEVVSCQVGHNDMKVSVQGNRDYYRGEVVPRYEFWLPPFGGCAVYYWDKPKAG
jgi:hypothetical protein